MTTGRLIAVLGYSPRWSDRLHPICAARVERAGGMAREGDLVVLSGWSRHSAVQSEAELMAQSWAGIPVELALETDARHTAGNAVAVAEVARSYAAREVVLVTSWWHRPRATALVRAALQRHPLLDRADELAPAPQAELGVTVKLHPGLPRE